MRYLVYKYVKKLSDSITEAVDYVNKHPKNVNLLSDCLVAICAIKDTLAKENNIQLNELDIFLDTVNEIINLVENNCNYQKQLNDLCYLAKKINNYCITKIDYRFKIVFFAELGSKWDSIDSVYWAYKNREDCEVEVVIAPIYRAIKLPNGEVKSDVIYKDYLTSMGIKHTLFKDYDIKKDLPDMVFSSQPYESVTTEQFWAENIAPYTKLIYLPYFTSHSILGDSEKVVQCQLPIHKLAWKVICQSENVKNLYSKYSLVQGQNLVAVGLPKWDWVINMNKRKIDFPEEWKKIKDKKIVLRNVHYNISNPIEFFESFRWEMKRFEGSNIGYLYRFHPMLETMFNIYYLKFKDKWERLKEEIKKTENFIIDENETYDCAFKFSDILVSSYSSIISQYLLTKKPIITLYLNHLEMAKSIEVTEETLVKTSELYPINDITELDNMYKKILIEGDDYDYKKRMDFIKRVLPNADGFIGERLSHYLIDELLKEDKISGGN